MNYAGNFLSVSCPKTAVIRRKQCIDVAKMWPFKNNKPNDQFHWKCCYICFNYF